jgi:DNA polymerase III subunit beta
MSQIVFKVGALRNALAKLGRVTGHSSIPLLDTVLIAPDGEGSALLRCTDLDIEMTIAVPATGSVAPFCVPVRPLRSVLAWLPVDEMVRLRPSPAGTEDARCLIDLPDGRARLLVLDASQWPDILSGDGAWGAWFDLDCAAITRLLPFVCTEETRYYLTGVALQQKDHGLVAVATDGHRCGFQTLGPRGNEPGDWSALLPRQLIWLLSVCGLAGVPTRARLRFMLAPDGSRLSPLRIEVANEVMQLRARLIDGAYPDWRKVALVDTDATVHFDRDVMLAAAKRLAVMAPGHITDFRVFADATGHLIGTSATPETTLTMRLPGEADCAFNVGFSARYFVDVLSYLPAGPVTWRFARTGIRTDGLNVPCRFDGDGRSVVLMPRRLSRRIDALDLGEAA